jgi:hypothetical protein
MSSLPALGQGIIAAYDGATITWAGTAANVNQFDANYGQGLINGVQVQIHGALFVTRGVGASAVFCNDTGGGQAKNTAYYVYYALRQTGGYTHVVSVTAPTPQGYPGANISFDSNGPTTTQKAVFLGSYMTDANADMIPFERHGEQVILTGGFGTLGTVQFTPTGALRQTFAPPVGFPLTASGEIVDFNVELDGTLGPLDIYVNALGGCNSAYLADLFSASSTAPGKTFTQYNDLILPIDQITLLLCAHPPTGTTIEVSGKIVGYVETFYHLY